jgi:hypothetical protein
MAYRLGVALPWLAGRGRHELRRAGARSSTYCQDIERVSLARTLDVDPERDDGHDLMEQLDGAEPPEVHWP